MHCKLFLSFDFERDEVSSELKDEKKLFKKVAFSGMSKFKWKSKENMWIFLCHSEYSMKIEQSPPNETYFQSIRASKLRSHSLIGECAENCEQKEYMPSKYY